MKNVKIKTRLSVGIALILVILVITNIISGAMMISISQQKNKLYDKCGEASQEILTAYADYQELKFLLRNMIYVHETDPQACAEDMTRMANVIEDISAHADSFEALADLDDKELKDQYEVVQDGLTAYVNSVRECISYVQGGDFNAAKVALTGEIIDQAKILDTEVLEMIDIMDKQAEDENKQSEVDTLYRLIGITIIALIAIVIGIVIDVTTSVAIRKPIRYLTEGLDKLTRGEVDAVVRKVNNDELGALVDDFNMLVEKTKAEAYIVSEISKGDLTMEVTPQGPNDILGNALLKLVNEDNAVLSNIHEASSQVTTGSEQVASASQSLAQGSTQQASAIEEITASISEIADRTKKNAEQANVANDLVILAKDGAAQGDNQMKDMIAAMTEINESSENISKIIKVIDDIAFQTNILALNAAVEAARAGSHGKGFAVVAEEVRSLAGKSASAASETAEMIEDSIKKVAHGSSLATETAKALEEIVEAVDKIVDIISDIASASNEQATAVAQIDQAINQVSQVVQTNSATSEQCAAASEELSNQSARLREMINRFHLKETDNYYGGYEGSDYSYPENDSVARTISLGDGFDKY